MSCPDHDYVPRYSTHLEVHDLVPRINSNAPVVPGPFSPRLQLTNAAWELHSLHPPSTSTVIRNVIWNSETADGGIDIGQVYY
jgi:hypothetical protein